VNVEFIRCPFCFCLFLTDDDLELHLRAFGCDVDEHERGFEFVHREKWCDFDEW
jgi:hypothetical protein